MSTISKVNGYGRYRVDDETETSLRQVAAPKSARSGRSVPPVNVKSSARAAEPRHAPKPARLSHGATEKSAASRSRGVSRGGEPSVSARPHRVSPLKPDTKMPAGDRKAKLKSAESKKISSVAANGSPNISSGVGVDSSYDDISSNGSEGSSTSVLSKANRVPEKKEKDTSSELKTRGANDLVVPGFSEGRSTTMLSNIGTRVAPTSARTERRRSSLAPICNLPSLRCPHQFHHRRYPTDLFALSHSFSCNRAGAHSLY